MTAIYHPALGRTVQVPEVSVYIHERAGWQRVDAETTPDLEPEDPESPESEED